MLIVLPSELHLLNSHTTLTFPRSRFLVFLQILRGLACMNRVMQRTLFRFLVQFQFVILVMD